MYFLRALGLSLITTATICGPALAGQIKDFNRDAFQAAQQTGKRVMVVVTSDRDPASEAQRPIIDKLSRDFLYPDVSFFRIDYDRMKDVMRELRITQDATIVVFKGIAERGRTVGEVNELALRNMLDRAR